MKSNESGETYKVEKQLIGLFSDQVSVSHATKCITSAAQPHNPLKYPTNYATLESLFQNSKTTTLIASNEPNINSNTMFSQSSAANSSNSNNQNFSFSNSSNDSNFVFISSSSVSPQNKTYQQGSTSQHQTIQIPMISIGIKSKFNTKTNTKNLLVALNFNNLTLHHLFSSQTDFWIFQLIQLFNLIDIDVLGYQMPLVLTELHLNVSNSCVQYNPVHLMTRSLVTFKSLHWSSNVTPESTLTLLVFIIEDIYLFLSKVWPQTE